MSICCKLVRALAVVLLAAYVASQELNSTLSTVSGISVAFANENAVFTCIARGSNHMGWSSDEYIGTGGRRLEFISTNAPGTIRTSGETRAELVSASVDQFIISRLYISIEPTIPVATVQCQNIGAGMMVSLPFDLADNDAEIVCDKLSVCPGEDVTCTCATGRSNTLAWVIDGSRQAFESTDPLLTTFNTTVTGSNAYGILTDRHNRNGIEVTTSNLTVTAFLSGGVSLLIQCENVDHSTSDHAIIQILQNCPDPSETTTPVPPGTKPTPSTSDGSMSTIIALAVVCAILVILFVAAVIIAVWKLIEATGLKQKIIDKNNEISRLEDEIKHLNKEIADRDGTIQELKSDNANKDFRISQLTAEKESLNKEKDDKIKSLEKDNKKLSTESEKKINGLKEKHKSEIQKKKDEIKALKEQLKKNVHDDSSRTGTFPYNNSPESRPGYPSGFVAHPSQSTSPGSGASWR